MPAIVEQFGAHVMVGTSGIRPLHLSRTRISAHNAQPSLLP
jgi:hypothetical protein